MKVLFLDFDGVLNSSRTCAAFDGYPFDLERDFSQFDHVAIALIQKVCEKTDCKVVVSSTWRLGTPAKLMIEKLKLPIIGRTPTTPELGLPMSSGRGNEIEAWLETHPEVTTYAIVDDESFDIYQKGRTPEGWLGQQL